MASRLPRLDKRTNQYIGNLFEGLHQRRSWRIYYVSFAVARAATTLQCRVGFDYTILAYCALRGIRAYRSNDFSKGSWSPRPTLVNAFLPLCARQRIRGDRRAAIANRADPVTGLPVRLELAKVLEIADVFPWR